MQIRSPLPVVRLLAAVTLLALAAIMAVLLGTPAVSTAASGPAAANHRSITPVPDRDPGESRAARRIARAMSTTPMRKRIRAARFSVLPPGANPTAISTKRLAAFPRHGSSYAIFSNGDATFADNPNTEPDTGTVQNGPFIRGARDVTIMRIDFRAPSTRPCLSIRFRYLTEEYPEFVGDSFNDAFIAELDTSSWKTGDNENPKITAPDNFAFDTEGNPISVNGTGDATMRSSTARGTTYDGATRLLRASVPVKRGSHQLYLSIFDQGDRIYDSAVFIDNITLDDRKPCQAGAVTDK